MLTTRGKVLLGTISIFLLAGYSLHWLHENPIVVRSTEENTTLEPVALDVNATELSPVLGNWTIIGVGRREYWENHAVVSTFYEYAAIKTADGREVLVDGKFNIKVKPREDSIEVTLVAVDMLAGNNTWLGDLVPDDYTGYLTLKATEGPYLVEPSYHGADPNKEACMVAALRDPNWGGEVAFDTWPDFSVRGTPPGYEGNLTFHIVVEYLVRTGPFTAEKKGITLRIPVELIFRSVRSGP